MTLRPTNKANHQSEDYIWKRCEVSLLSVRNIKEGADTRSHECKANSIFSLTCTIQVDNAICTQIKRLSVSPAWGSPAGSCIIAHVQLGVHFAAALYSELQFQWPDNDDRRLHSRPISTSLHHCHTFWTFLMSRILAPIMPNFLLSSAASHVITQPQDFETSLILKRESLDEMAELTMRPQAVQQKSRQDPCTTERSKDTWAASAAERPVTANSVPFCLQWDAAARATEEQNASPATPSTHFPQWTLHEAGGNIYQNTANCYMLLLGKRNL